ncbi:MAG: hypothetical protein JNJ73_02025 [Hyphomonadaceae bacterium]|nr:hypothetical protein [Hyphomonadaceae bacterium]
MPPTGVTLILNVTDNDPAFEGGGQSGDSLWHTPAKGHPENPPRGEETQKPIPEDDEQKGKYLAPLTPYIERGNKAQGGSTIAITDAGLDMVERLASEGHTDTRIAGMIGVRTRAAFKAMRQSDERIDEALAAGRSVLESEITDILLAQARKGVTIAAFFLAKTRLGWREDGTPPPSVQQINNNQTINIVLPPAMSDAQFRALLPPGLQTEAIDAD